MVVVMDRLFTTLEARMEAVDLDSCSDDDLQDLVSQVNQAQRLLVAYQTQLAAATTTDVAAGPKQTGQVPTRPEP